MKVSKRIAVIILLLVLVYLAGPRPKALDIDNTPVTVDQNEELISLEKNIKETEKRISYLKPDNEAKIVWADSVLKEKTAYSIVYLHGFSASHGEGYPIHTNIAQRYGCNLYLSRLHAHGLNEDEPLINFSAEELVQSAKEAIAVGKLLGEKVILLSTSTGGTLSLYLAGSDDDIAGLIMYSPNIDLYDNKSFLLTQPWGLHIAKMVMGSNYFTFDASPDAQQYWTTKYRLEALIELKNLVNTTMNENTFKSIKQPVFLGYYYKNEKEQDDVVSVPRMLEMYEQLGTSDQLKRKVNFPDAGYHVIGSSYWNTNTQAIEDATCDFLEEIMHLKIKK